MALGALPALLITWSTSTSLPFLALWVAAAGQGVKVTCDALVQHHVADAFRGQVFAIYDMSVNIWIVVGAVIAATMIAPNGRGALVPVIVSLTYLTYAALLMGRWFKPDLPTTSPILP